MRAPLWLLVAVTGFSWANCALAQDATGSAGGPTTGGSATPSPSAPPSSNDSSAGTGNSGTGSSILNPKPPADTGTGTGTSTGTGTGTSTGNAPSGTGTGETGVPNPFLPEGPGVNPFESSTGASSSFGSGGETAAKPKPAVESTTTGTEIPQSKPLPETFSAPGLYGSGAINYTAGEGRFARPRFRYSGGLSFGFDDNIYQTPTESFEIPDQTFLLVTPGSPEISQLVTKENTTLGKYYGGNFPVVTTTTTEKVIIQQGTPTTVEEVVVPGFKSPKRQSSFFTQANVGFDVQFARARSAFTLDFDLGASYYYSREPDPLEYNGSLAYTYIRRITPRIQFSSTGSIAYLSQPDYTSLTASTLSNGGSYINGSIKFDLSYRLASRLSAVTSFNLSTLVYETPALEGSNYYTPQLGTELRYIWSRRLTLVGEARYALSNYFNLEGRNSNTAFALLGADWRYSPRLSGTLRIGESVRTFEVGDPASTPYVEASLSYQPTRRSIISCSSRYGFEESSDPNLEVIGFRSSLSYRQAFTPRLSGFLSASYLNETITNKTLSSADPNETATIDGSMGLEYVINRHFSVGARYSYTQRTSSQSVSDFYRNRVYFTGSYQY